MSRVVDLSDAEGSNYLSTLASILEATGRNAEASVSTVIVPTMPHGGFKIGRELKEF